VLLVCPEPLGHGQPAGIGIRFVEIAKVLLGEGHDVTIVSPDGGTAGSAHGLVLTPTALQEATRNADVAFVQGHVANELFAYGEAIPTVVDLYDPYLVENLHYYETHGAQVFTHDHATLMASLRRGDFFLCASQTQRHFYLGLLLAAGRVNPELFARDPRLESLLAIAPFGVQPAVPNVRHETAGPAVLFGGVYDWYDPILAIDAVALARREIADLTLTFTRHPNASVTPQGQLAAAMDYVARNRYEHFIRFEPWASYDERAAFFRRFSVALLTFPQSLETDLSMRTRIYDYLWGALPIVTSSAPGTDELLLRYGAGSIVHGHDPAAFSDALIATLRDRARYARMVEGTTRFTEEHQWARVLEPLLAFCRAPHVEATKARFAVAPVAVPPQPESLLTRVKRRLRGAR
jgi:glycosyltransferase involved in cell wall biosynthesis